MTQGLHKPSLIVLLAVFLCMAGCENAGDEVHLDTPFTQEYHVAYPLNDASDQVRGIAIDGQSTIWIATATGIFNKPNNTTAWNDAVPGAGSAYTVRSDPDGSIWAGTWNGLYHIVSGHAEKINGIPGPVSVITPTPEKLFILGPKGFWIYEGKHFQKTGADISRAVRDAIPDGTGGLYIASDVGLYHWTKNKTAHFYNTTELISGYAKGLASGPDDKLWVGGLGGVTVRNRDTRERVIKPADGLPSVYVTTVRKAPDQTMWVGTDKGVVRFTPDGRHSLRFSRRWLVDDQVTDIAFDKQGNAWIATPKGVSAIMKRTMTLAAKEQFFYDVLMKRHIRAPWIAGQCHLAVAGDTAKWMPEDDDNDGEYTGNYLAMESFRYAATKTPEAKQNARKAFDFLKMLQEVTGTNGFFARTIIPADWKRMHDENRTYTEQELSDELVKEPRFKPVEVRWHKSADGKWFWKGDTSSDEMCGHMFGYYFYYTLVADDAEKKRIAAHVAGIVDHLIANNYNLIDVDGRHTRWSVWSPDQLNRDPDWLPDRNQNSMEMLTFLKLAFHMTGNVKYQNEYLRLIQKEGYLGNMSNVTNQNPAWLIYFDLVLQAYLYPILLHCEKDPELLKYYRTHLDRWYEKRKGDQNPLINFIYCYSSGKKVGLKPSVGFLTDTPLDLTDWPIDHRKREDVTITRTPVLEDEQVSPLQPASLRMAVRWDKNPWTLAGGDPHTEREPVFWLLPYWMGRQLQMIK